MKALVSTLALAVAASVSAVQAQTTHARPTPPLVKALDANGDGVIDASEIANAPKSLLTLDKNGDGQLTRDEYAPARRGPVGPPPPDGSSTNAPGHGARRPPAPPLVKALDANGDGVIDASEIANAPASLLTLDKNGDGQLTKDEYAPARRGSGAGHFGPPPGGSSTNSPGHVGNHPPLPPLVAALDANGDGVIDASEIANAPAALLTLDKNGDGQLTEDEIRPARPQRPPQLADGDLPPPGDGPMPPPPGEGGPDDGPRPPGPDQP